MLLKLQVLQKCYQNVREVEIMRSEGKTAWVTFILKWYQNFI